MRKMPPSWKTLASSPSITWIVGLVSGRLQRLLNLLRHHFGGAGHGTHEDRDVYAHGFVPTASQSDHDSLPSAWHYYTCRLGSIMHPPWAGNAT